MFFTCIAETIELLGPFALIFAFFVNKGTRVFSFASSNNRSATGTGIMLKKEESSTCDGQTSSRHSPISAKARWNLKPGAKARHPGAFLTPEERRLHRREYEQIVALGNKEWGFSRYELRSRVKKQNSQWRSNSISMKTIKGNRFV